MDPTRFVSFEEVARPDLTIETQACDLDAKHGMEYMQKLSAPNAESIRAKMPSIAKSKGGNWTSIAREFHASDFRYLLGLVVDEGNEVALELVKDFVPNPSDIDIVLSLLDDVKIPVQENKKKLSMHHLYSLVEEILDEMSGMGGGACAGFAGGAFASTRGAANRGTNTKPYKRDTVYKRDTKKKKKKLKKNRKKV